MPQKTTEKSAYDLIESTDADVLRSPETVLELAYECPDCGQADGMVADVFGVRAICHCPECREGASDEEYETYGVHDLLGQYIIKGGSDFSLKDVPAHRATVVEGN